MNQNEKSELFDVWGEILHIHKYDFSTPLDFLGIMDLKKIIKKPKKISKATPNTTPPFHTI